MMGSEKRQHDRVANALLGRTLEINAMKLYETAKEVLSQMPSDYDQPARIFVEGFSLREEVQKYELSLIQLALKSTNGHQRKAADLLGLKYTTLHAKILNLFIDYDRTEKFHAK